MTKPIKQYKKLQYTILHDPVNPGVVKIAVYFDRAKGEDIGEFWIPSASVRGLKMVPKGIMDSRLKRDFNISCETFEVFAL